MKSILIIFTGLLILSACGTSTKDADSTLATDSTTIDSTLATTLAPAMLAFDQLDGFEPKKELVSGDSVNYFLLLSDEELKSKFSGSASSSPDFIINHVVAVVAEASPLKTTITMTKVEVGQESIDVYLTLERGEKLAGPARGSRVFVIERRDGYPTMQFFINGKKDKSLIIAGL